MRNPKGTPLVVRLERLSMPVTESGCIIWLGTVNEDGYGQIDVNSRIKNRKRRAA